MPVVGKWNKSTWLTYASVAAAGTSMYFALVGENTSIAHALLLLAGVCDMFDGFVARKCKRDASEKHYGVELDSLADTVSFVATPVVIAFALGAKEWYEVATLIFFMICGVARLAFFNILVEKDSNKPVKYYRGLPVTFTAFFLPIVFLALSKLLPSEITPIMYVSTMAIIGMLNILDFHCPKPKPSFYGVFSVIAILTAAALLFL
jgi:CDP-diacylglycerol--serine O-phosphatidyltransferase